MDDQNSAQPLERNEPQAALSAKPSIAQRAAVMAIVAVALLALLTGLGWEMCRTFGWFGAGKTIVRFGTEIAPPAPDDPAYKAVAVADPALAGLPYAPGWPLALPGEIIATPAVADLLGDGQLEVIVPCIARSDRVNYVNPHPNRVPLLFAFRADGSVLPGWPIDLRTPDDPDRARGVWASSPSIFRAADGRDRIAIVGPGRTVFIIGGDRSIKIVGDTDATVAVPIVPLTGAPVDLISSNLAVDSEGNRVNGFNVWEFGWGYCPCIGDANGDGKLEMFHLHYGNGHGGPLLVGYDATGKELPNWKKQVSVNTWRPPAMGDIDGSGTMSIIAGYGHEIFAWHNTCDPLESDIASGKLAGIFKTHIVTDTATPALADLTGSGHADIVVFDRATHRLHAWHADGTPVWPPPAAPPALPATPSAPAATPPTTRPSTRPAIDPLITTLKNAFDDSAFGPATRPADDGSTIATLPIAASGVSVASLGDDPKVMDFFVGTYWVRHFPDGHTTVTNMLPAPPSPAHTEWAQPTIADLEHTGQADIIFGTTDGRLVVYRTGLAYHPERMEWPTVNGNFQHTGAWTPPKKRGT